MLLILLKVGKLIYKNMKKYYFLLAGALMPLVTFANGTGESGFGHQMRELSPFEHMGEGHWYAFVLSTVLWLSLIYTVYSLVKKSSNNAGSVN